jgi:hypothetical protein
MKYHKGDQLVVTKEFATLLTPFQQMRFSEGQEMVIVETIDRDINGGSAYLVRCRDVTFVINKETLEHVAEFDAPLSDKRYSKIIATGLTYGQAMEELLVKGKLVTRKVWDGYWTVQTLGNLTGEPAWHGRFIVAKLKNGGFAVASPYQEDMFARDWMVVE